MQLNILRVGGSGGARTAASGLEGRAGKLPRGMAGETWGSQEGGENGEEGGGRVWFGVGGGQVNRGFGDALGQSRSKFVGRQSSPWRRGRGSSGRKHGEGAESSQRGSE